MSRSSAFEPIWPPASDDDFEAWPEIREARKMFDAQKLQMQSLAERGLRLMPGDRHDDIAHDLAVMLHNIGGTAAHFDEGPLGHRAAELEELVRNAANADALRPYCAHIVGFLGRAA